MDFRFFLIDKDGLPASIDEPVGFDNFKPKLVRGKDSHGMSFEFSEQSLGFYRKAYEMVTEEYAVNGVEGALTFLVEYYCGGEWREFYRGDLDFSFYEEKLGDSCIVETKIAQMGALVTFNNRRETGVYLNTTSGFEGASLPAYSNLGKVMSIPGKVIPLVNRLRLEEDSTVVFTDEQNPVYKAPFGTTIGNVEFGTVDSGSVLMNMGGLSGRPEATIFLNDTEEDIKVSIEGAAYLLLEQMPNQTWADMPKANLMIEIYDGINNIQSMLFNKSIQKSIIYVPGYIPPAINIDFKDVVLNKGWKINIYISVINVFQQLNVYPFTLYSYSGGYLNMVYNSKELPSNHKVYMIHEVLSRITESITDGALTVKSDYYGRTDSNVNPATAEKGDGIGSLRCITNGYFLRNAILSSGNNPYMFASFKDIMDGLTAIDAVGCGVEGDKIRIEPLEYFYNNDVLLECTGIAEWSRKVDGERCFALVNTGYDKWESEEWYSIDGFHNKRQYRTRLKNGNGKFEKFCKFIADGYAIEATRRKGLDMKDQLSEWRYDNNIFIFDLFRSENNALSVTIGDGDPDTLIAPDSLINVELSPARMAARWFGWIMQAVKPVAGDALIFSSAEGYVGARTRSKKDGQVIANDVWITEDDDLTIDKIATPSSPIVKPELVEFKYPLTVAEFVAIRDNPYGLIGFDGYYGWIREVEYDINKGEASFTLIPKSMD